jgi:transcriptional regulator with XRE-family HTH domain
LASEATSEAVRSGALGIGVTLDNRLRLVNHPSQDWLLTTPPTVAYLGHMTTTESPAPALVPEWTVHDRCRKARESAKLSQMELADRTGISRATIVNYENGHVAHPSRAYLNLWAMACGVDRGWLETGVFIARGSSTRSDYTGPGRKSPGKVRAGRGAEVARLARAALAAEVEAA